jgi:TonB family protein
MIKRMTISTLILCYGIAVGQSSPAKTGHAPQQVCQLISANSPDFHPFAFVPVGVKDKKLVNRLPRVSFVVGEDGKVRDAKVVKGTGSPTVDAAIVKSVESWKYKPQPGCEISMSMAVNIDTR